MELDFSELTYNISTLKKHQLVIMAFPELAQYTEFSDPNDDDILKWVFLLVDRGSPFQKLHKDFYKRGKAILEYLKIEDNHFSDYVNGVHIPKPSEYHKIKIKVQSMIWKCFVVLDEATYMTWYSLYSSFHEMNAFIQTSIPFDDRDYERKFKTKEEVTKLLPDKQRQLAEYEKIVFGDSKIKQIASKEVAKIINWPEKMALNYEDE